MKKRLYFLSAISFCIFLILGIFFAHGFDSFRFHRMADAFFTQSLENDALNLHFTLAHPDDFGISLKSATLPVYSREADLKAGESARAFYQKLSRIRPDRLKEEDQYTYSLLLSYLEQEIQGQDFPYYDEPFSPSSGMQSELLLLLAEYTLRDRTDVEIYLSLLESVSPYLQGLSDYESEKSRAGLFMTAEDAASVVSQCDAVIDEASLTAGTHFLQTTFAARLESLLSQDLITEQEMGRYLSENDRILATVVLPAYQKLGDDLILLSGTGQYSGGLCEKPDGRDYYAWLVNRTTGSCLDVDGIYPLLQKSFQKKYGQLKDIVLQYQALTGHAPDLTLLTDTFPLNDPEEILSDLQKRMQPDFPSLAAFSSGKISCTIKDVDTALEAYTSPAFYMTPPIDDLLHNTICINRASTSNGIELYTTLAHEGYPGHLYQTVYSSLYAAQKKELPVRELLFYGGYVEGWAYYTEQLSYDYAAQLFDSSASQSEASLLCRLVSVQRDLQINLFSLLDLSLHYYGAAKEDILHSLTSFGLNEETAERIYNYIRTDPAAYLKYYVGYLEMTALRERARAQWGENFSLLKFHQFVLEAGPSDFPHLVTRLKQTK